MLIESGSLLLLHLLPLSIAAGTDGWIFCLTGDNEGDSPWSLTPEAIVDVTLGPVIDLDRLHDLDMISVFF